MAIWQEMLIAFKEIIASPFKDWSVWWMLAPVVILWITLELYFGKHKHEKLGWNTALGNGISLAWITVALMKFLFENNRANFTWPKFFLVIVVLLYGLFIAYISFTHKLSAKSTYLLADPTPIYFLSSIAILWAFDSLVFTRWVFLDLIILFPIIIGIFALIKKIIPSAEMGSEESGDEPGLEEEDLGLDQPQPAGPAPGIPPTGPRTQPPGMPPGYGMRRPPPRQPGYRPGL